MIFENYDDLLKFINKPNYVLAFEKQCNNWLIFADISKDVFVLRLDEQEYEIKISLNKSGDKYIYELLNPINED